MRFIALGPARPGGVGPRLVRWLLALGWWLALGGALRRGLRSALGGGLGARGPQEPEPPIRPRRPKASRRGAAPPSYAAAA